MFKDLFKKKALVKPGSAIGLDIGNSTVKIVEIRREDESNLRLAGIGYSQINTNDPKGVLESIKAAIKEANITNREVNASIFPDGVIVRFLLLPVMNQEELNKAMHFEIERYIPFSKEEVVSDYRILKEDEQRKNMKVLLVAAKKEFVDNRTKLIQEAGLIPQVITIDSLVLKNAFRFNYPEKENITVGLLNIGSKITNINIVREDFSYFMRDVQIGSDNITYLIKEKFDIDNLEAEKMKFEFDLKNQEVFKVIEPVLGNLLNEIYLSFDFYESEFGLVVDEVYLSGGFSSAKWLTEFLKENLGREIKILEPTKKFTLGASLSSEKIKKISTSLAISIGLALESFN